MASRPKTIEGLSGLLNFVMLPMWILSGVFFEASNFPDVMQPFIQVLPLTALIDALRAVVNDGAPLRAVWSDLSILVAWGSVSFVVALKIFRWQ
ncbi:MAG: ABC transporter permease [Acidobacteria bacterium]|nr:ABC transporter permease [Acidobacteriota bacterium]